MSRRLPLRCQCGTVTGFVSDVRPTANKRAICYCDDCQIYALHLGREDILDARGGTEALMSSPAHVTLSTGLEQLRCVRLSPKGLYRWYAGCCNSPLGNTLSARVPVLIVPTVSLDLAAAQLTPDEALGPVAVRMMARFAKGGVPPGAHPKVPLRMAPALLGHLAKGLLSGRNQPSPFVDERGEPRVVAQLMDQSEREALRARVLASAS